MNRDIVQNMIVAGELWLCGDEDRGKQDDITLHQVNDLKVSHSKTGWLYKAIKKNAAEVLPKDADLDDYNISIVIELVRS